MTLSSKLFAIMILLCTVSAHAQTGKPAPYASFLFSNGYYPEARGEFLSELFKAGNNTSSYSLKIWVARTYLEEKKYSSSRKELSAVVNGGSVPAGIKNEASFHYIRSCFLSGDYALGADFFIGRKETVFREKAAALWLLTADRNWTETDKLAQYFMQLKQNDVTGYSEEEYETVRSVSEKIRNRPDFRTKSPGLAALLSALLPGSGHAYAGNYTSAFGAFLINGAFIGLTAYALRDRNYILAGIAGFIEVGWYTGNIVSAYNEAQLVNQRNERLYTDPLLKRFPYGFGYSREF